MKKIGFTLAEVLITLAIIGLIATVTLPALKADVDNRGYEAGIKKAANTVANAVQLYMAEAGISDLGGAAFINNQNELQSFVKKYFNVVQDCGTRYYLTNGAKCFAKSYRAIDSDNFVANVANSQCMSVVLLNDGMSMCLDSGAMDPVASKDDNGNDITITSSNHAYDGNIALTVEVDVNGIKGPNISGRDMFKIEVDRYGKLVDTQFDPARADDSIKTYLNGEQFPMGIGRIRSDGWQIKYLK